MTKVFTGTTFFYMDSAVKDIVDTQALGAFSSVDAGELSLEDAYWAHLDEMECALSKAGYVVVDTTAYADYDSAFARIAASNSMALDFFPFSR